MRPFIGIGALAVVLAVSACSAGGTAPGSSPSVTARATGTFSAGVDAAAGAAVSYRPAVAQMPPTTHASHPATAHPTSSTPAGRSGGSSGSGSPGGGTAGAPPPATSTCTHPVYTTSDPNGMQDIDGYWLDNDAWNAANYSVTQTLYACSPGSWYVTAKMNNNNGDGAVKTYPNAHKDFNSNPTITGFNSITSTFAQSGTPAGIYEYAYDIWINGVASSGSTEVMIWTYNHGQVPGGSDEGQQAFSGHSFEVWRNGTYIAFVAKQNFTSGTIDLLQVFKWIISKGWLTSSATLGAVDYGIELVSTDNVPETFAITNYSVTTS